MTTPQPPVPPTGSNPYVPTGPVPGDPLAGQPAGPVELTPPNFPTTPTHEPTKPGKRGNVLTSKPVIGIAALVVGLALGASAGGSGKTSAATAAAAPTITVTATVQGSEEPVDATTAEPTQEPSEEPTPTAEPAPEKKSYATLSSRKFKLLTKDPDSYIGKTYLVYGEITQFDAATGTDTFRADTGPKKLRISSGYTDYDQNSFLTGTESKLKKLVEGDCFTAKVTVLGSFSYDTQAGGNTTVPLFQIDSIKVYGSTD